LGPRGGPVQFWDVHSGREVRRFLDDVSSLDSLVFSDDGRMLFAAARHTGAKRAPHLHRVDLDTGRESHVPIEAVAPRWAVRLAPSGKLLVLESAYSAVMVDGFSFEALPGLEPQPKPEPQPSYLLVYDAQSLRLLTKEDGGSWHWRWAPDGEALLLFAAHDNGKASLRRITAQAETITLFDGAGNWLAVTPDGKTLLTAWPAAEGDGPGPSVLLWDTVTGKRRGEIRRMFPGDPPDLGKAFLSNGRTLVITQEGAAGEAVAGVWDLDTHASIGKVPQENRRMLVSAERDAIALYLQDPPNQLAVYRVRPLVQLWQREVLGGILRTTEFLSGTKRLLVRSGEGGAQRLELYDVDTGENCLNLPVIDQHHFMQRGRYLAVVENIAIPQETRGFLREVVDKWFAMVFRAAPARADFETVTRVVDTQTGEQLCRLELRGATLVDLAPDGRSIFMQEEDRDGNGGVLSCYDVPARRYWTWIIGIPLAVALLLVGLRAAWLWVRTRKDKNRI
jgi:WD40 repeat protein